MRRRLLTSTALIAVAAVLVLGIPLAFVEAHRERADATARLEREADAVAAAVDDRLEAGPAIHPRAPGPPVRPAHQVVIRPPSGAPVVVGSAIAGRRLSAASGTGSSSAARVTAAEPAGEMTARVVRSWLLIGLLSTAGVGAAVLVGALQGR